jgi:hypothetical protein
MARQPLLSHHFSARAVSAGCWTTLALSATGLDMLSANLVPFMAP